ncbi:hypothetical protein BVI1335_1520062 [Burkholderia vietnamiensis]|nr:hypothetical protein BVI1335_1520062 [Burkholderia vietnamiensis]
MLGRSPKQSQSNILRVNSGPPEHVRSPHCHRAQSREERCQLPWNASISNHAECGT